MNFRGILTLRSLFLLLFALSAVVRCSHTPAGADGAELLFREAEEAFEDERYLLAIEKYREVKSRYPYSPRATDSELRLADAYFAQESYIEAESAYEVFRELHPTHPKIDYVYYRIALAAYEQVPQNSARDLTAAHRAIEAFRTVKTRYPGSEYAKDADEKIAECRRRLAEHESYVADFYFQREHFLSASYRYSALLQDFGDMGYDEEALFRLGKCYANTRMFESARDTLKQFVARFPESPRRSEAESLLGTMKN